MRSMSTAMSVLMTPRIRKRWGLWLSALVALALLPRASGALTYDTSYFGNSFPGTPNRLHVQDDILGLYVAPDGTCYTNSIWDEGGSEAGIYKNGQVIGNCDQLHGWGRGGAAAITADANYLYVAMQQTGDDGANTGSNSNGLPNYPAPNNVWYCIRRYTLAGVPAPFPTGAGFDGSMLIVNSGVRPNGQSPYSGKNVSGIAVGGGSLYVSDPVASQVKKYSLAALSGTPAQTWNLSQPGPMVQANGSLWVIQNGSGPQILQSSADGPLQSAITFAPGVVPAALAYSPTTNTLLVVDQGPDQNVKKYSLSALAGSPTQVVGTFGTTGGIYAGTGWWIGTAGLCRFNNPTGVGVDKSGNIYVSQDGTGANSLGGGGAVLESYTGAKTRNWQLFDLEFIDCACVDPGSEKDVFTKEEHFVMNYNNTAPGSEAKHVGYTINRLKYPEDPRMHLGAGNESAAWVRRFRGHEYLITTDMYSSFLCIARFNTATDGQCAVPSVVFSQSYHAPDSTGWPENEPSAGEWIWRDANGNGALDAGEYTRPSGGGSAPSSWGWWIDSNGDVWQATQNQGIRHYVCRGLDSKGNPIYDYSHMTTIPMPADFNDVERAVYYPATDTMYVSGFSSVQPNDHGYWGGVGKVICRYDHWSTAPAMHPGYPILPTFNGTATPPVFAASMDIAGSYLFLANVQQNLITAYNVDTGAQAGTMIPGASIGGDGTNDINILGWVDIRNGVEAYRRSNGEYLIFVEDDWLGKIVMYRWTP